MPSLSVIIPIWSKTSEVAEVAERCMRAVATHTPGAQLIVVDNNSPMVAPKGTVAIRNNENVGVAAAWNKGATKATGECLVFLNSDCEVSEGWAEGLFSHIDDEYQGKPIAAISPVLCNTDEELRRTRTFSPPLLNKASGHCFMVRRKVLEDVGPFDERFFLYCEDEDWFRRAEKKKYTLVTTKDAWAKHICGLSARQHPNLTALIEESRRKYKEKYND